MIDALEIKKDFPIFDSNPNLVYLDSTATTLKPRLVIAKENEYYEKYSANIFRGIYKISERATTEYESVRDKIATFIGGKSEEVIFVRNATEAVNLVVTSWGGEHIREGAEIVTTVMEHHANFVPWQVVCKEKRAKFVIVPITADGKINKKQLLQLVTAKTVLVALVHVSNVLGTINPIAEIIAEIKSKNPQCLVLVDGAQAVPHLSVNVYALGCDFYVFSGHKMLGPTGIGVLWGRKELLEVMHPYQYGGEMIEAVYPDHSIYKAAPHKFEAGTPHIAGVIGLGAAVDYLENLGMNNIRVHEQELVSYALEKLGMISELNIVGPTNAKDRGGVIAFTVAKLHPHDIAQILDSNNICIRSGHHCAMPLHLSLKLAATARASFYIYTTKEDIDKLIEGIKEAIRILS